MVFAAVKWVTWDQATVAALVCGAFVFVFRRLRPTRFSLVAIPAARELMFISSIYAIWRVARMLPLAENEGAIERARQLDQWQQAVHLPTELSVQRFVVGYDWLAQASNVYYATVHVPSLIVFMIWLYVRHPENYLRWRTALSLLTAFCLVIRFIRVAPPRFLPELGFVDLGTHFGLSVYGPVGSGVSDQFAAMPSIHVAWAAVVSFGIVAATTSRWRWVFLLHLPVTIFVVAATGHHWWLDGIVAVALLGVGLLMDTLGRRFGPQLTKHAPKLGQMIAEDERTMPVSVN